LAGLRETDDCHNSRTVACSACGRAAREVRPAATAASSFAANASGPFAVYLQGAPAEGRLAAGGVNPRAARVP
jgi:hypothetical protein